VDAIDVHFHIVPQRFVDLVRGPALREIVKVEWFDGGRPPGDMGVDRLHLLPPPGIAVEPDTSIRPHLYEPALILDALDRRGLDAAAVSPPPEFFLYWAPPELGITIARAFNDGFAELQRADPDRVLPLATLPMQAPAEAADELERAVRELGLRGAALCTHVNGKDLDQPEFRPVFATAARLGVPIFLHPQSSGDVSRLEQYHLWNLIGFPMEAAIAASRLVMGGVFEKLPGLRVILAHGGGFFPYQIGRLDHGYAARPELQARLPRRPSEYLSSIYADSLIHDGRSLRFLIDRFGADHVVLGCDYPFDMGCDRPADAVRELGLAPDTERAILGGTLARLLGVG
jgi:aminocarboxymuconate-semialdehyde decarboxylase